MNASRPKISSLDNPLYYLENFRTVLAWVGTHHVDLLEAEEQAQLQAFEHLSTAAQGLLARLVMRRGTQFRLGKLSYPELDAPIIEAVEELATDGWISTTTEISLEGLFRLFTRTELQSMLGVALEATGLPRSANKQQMLEALQAQSPEPQPLQCWCPGHAEQVLELLADSLFQRVRLMFFGNLHQDWSQFVLTELGHQQYEPVPFSPESRAFQQRHEVELYLQISTLREALGAGQPPADLYPLVPPAAVDNDWLEERRGRLLYQLGHQAERDGDYELALELYAQSGFSEALVRRLRVMERLQMYADAYPLARSTLAAPKNDRQAQAVERVLRRVTGKLGLEKPRPAPVRPIPEFELTLSRIEEGSVELAVADALGSGREMFFYVENWLFNGLFALLCWPALFAPLRGAFFHPFHAAPADLYRDGFVETRREHFDECLASLESGAYRGRIRDTWQRKQGTSCSFVYWPLLNREMLELALRCIPAAHLRRIFERMLSDLRDNRAGIPDLVAFTPKTESYRLVEVKAPGDRLQDNQKRWFACFLEHEIPAELCRVNWAAE